MDGQVAEGPNVPSASVSIGAVEDVTSSSASAIECHYLQATALLCISIGTELLCSFLCMLGLSWVAFCFLRQGLTYT